MAGVGRSAGEPRQGLEDVPRSVWRGVTPAAGPWIKDVLSIDRAVAARRSQGGTAPIEARRQIAALRRLLRLPR